MSVIEFRNRLQAHKDAEAFWVEGHSVSFAEFLETSDQFGKELERAGIPPFAPALIEGNINPESVALLWACVERKLICIPHLETMAEGRVTKMSIAAPEWTLKASRGVDGRASLSILRCPEAATRPEHYNEIARRGVTGLVLFTSGTTGVPKAAAHDFTLLLERFLAGRRAMRTVAFLLFDHWGGLNTILYSLCSGGSLICVDDRMPDAVARVIEASKAELLPVSPSFLNLFLAARTHQRFDLSCLRLVTYGAEPMPLGTLEALRQSLPDARTKQTYGLIELGVFSTKSRDEGSLFFKIDQSHAKHRIVDGILQIKTRAAMLGYLNAPSPFTEDVWYITGDEVEQDGEYIRVLGRKSDVINVGGEKVHPSEVENTLLELEDVVEARVWGEDNFLLGNIVCAEVHLGASGRAEAPDAKINAIKRHCAKRLQSFKVPVKVSLTDTPIIGDRLKKKRSNTS